MSWQKIRITYKFVSTPYLYADDYLIKHTSKKHQACRPSILCTTFRIKPLDEFTTSKSTLIHRKIRD